MLYVISRFFYRSSSSRMERLVIHGILFHAVRHRVRLQDIFVYLSGKFVKPKMIVAVTQFTNYCIPNMDRKRLNTWIVTSTQHCLPHMTDTCGLCIAAELLQRGVPGVVSDAENPHICSARSINVRRAPRDTTSGTYPLTRT